MNRGILLAAALVVAVAAAVALSTVAGTAEPAQMEFEDGNVFFVADGERYDLELSDNGAFEEITVESDRSGAVSLRVTDSVTYDEAFEVRQIEENESREVDMRELNLSVESGYYVDSDGDTFTVRQVPEDVEVLERDDIQVEYNVTLVESKEADETEAGEEFTFEIEGTGDENETNEENRSETYELR